MLPMLLVIGLAVVAFMKRCELLPELCNPSQQASAIPPATASGAPLVTWEDYKKAAKEAQKDKKRDDETQKVAQDFTRRTGIAIPTNAPKPDVQSGFEGGSANDLENYIRGRVQSKYSRVAYF